MAISLDDFLVLRDHLAAGKATPEWELLCRHDLLRDKANLPWRDRVFRVWRTTLALLGAKPYFSKYVWLASLKHKAASADSQVVLIWAMDCVPIDEMRNACHRIQDRLGPAGLLPVLLTNTADFAFYSRLGWLVEYLPELSGSGVSYADRKCRYLAWRYREATVVPLSAGLAAEAEWESILKNGLP